MYAPKSVTQPLEHRKCTTDGVQALKVPAEHGVCWVDPDGQKVPSTQKACTVGLLQKLPSVHGGQTVLIPVPLE